MIKKMKKLARRGFARTLGLIAAIFLGVGVLTGFMAGMQDPEAGWIMVIVLICMFGMIFFILALVGLIPYWRLGRLIQKQYTELGLDPESEEEFENVTKEVSMSQNWLINGAFGSSFALHRKKIVRVEEATYYQRAARYPMVLIITDKKKYKIICSRKGDFARIMDALDQWFPPEGGTADLNSETAGPSLTEDNTLNGRRQRLLEEEKGRLSGGKIAGYAVAVIAMIVVFGFGYNALISTRKPAAAKPNPGITDKFTPQTSDSESILEKVISSSDDEQFKALAQELVKVSGDEDEIEVYMDELEDGRKVFTINNTSDTFFNGILTVIEEGEEIADLAVILMKPNASTILAETVTGDPDKYMFSNTEYYSLTQGQTDFSYAQVFDWDDSEDWNNVLTETETMDEETARTIAQAEYWNNIIAGYPNERYYFYDASRSFVNQDQQQGLDRQSARYKAVVDTAAEQIEMYVIENGTETALSPISMK